jgi:type IV pilus assembly protein PilY1
VLYIIDIKDGSLIKSIILDDSSGNNGLASPLAIDTNGDRIIDRIYVGDLKGNMWRIDVGDSNINQWKSPHTSAGKAVPLFTAIGPGGEVQPITCRADAAKHPDGSSIMLYFGTGSFYNEGDNVVPVAQSDREVQSFYGIRDNDSVIDNTRASGVYEQLQNQEIIFEGSPTVAGGTTMSVRAITNTSVDYLSKKGWYLDLVSPVPALGKQEERVISRPLLRHDRVIFATVIPSTHACEFGGTSWLMELDALSGGRLSGSVFDINQDGVIDDRDYVEVDGEWIAASGVGSEAGIVQTPRTVLKKTDGGGECQEIKYMTGSNGEIFTVTEKCGDGAILGRRSWRELR